MGERLRVWMRHAQSVDNKQNRLSGWRDVPLTPEGAQQTRTQAWKIARFGIAGIVSSDLPRARETAWIIQRTLALPSPQWLPGLRERNWGEWEGRKRPRLSDAAFERGAPGGETLDALRQRVRNTLPTVPDGVLVITHAGWLRCWTAELHAETISSLEPGSWILDPHGSCKAPAELRIEGTVLTPGVFEGRVKYVTNEKDLAGLDAQCIAMLAGCSKSVAVEALERACAAVNLMRSLTAHLSFGRMNDKPYAVARFCPDGLPPEAAVLRLCFQKIRKEVRGSLFPDIKPRPAHAPSGWVGKAAGLHLLRMEGFSVPEFYVITARRLAAWQKRNFTAAARAWVTRTLTGKTRWAVRSSANVEDSPDDPMSGSFETRLDCPADRVPAAIAEVMLSTGNREIRERLRSGKLRQAPRMAIVVQQMVSDPWMSGTVFIPAPDNPAKGLIECTLRALSDALMDGRTTPELIARFNTQEDQVEVESFPGDEIHALDRERLADVVSQAQRIYRQTGRGDLEFAVDRHGRCHWLQARMLPAVVEIVDRRGFAPAALRYYKLLAFSVAKANHTQQPYFRCVDLPDGRFGYTVGILKRDQLFQEQIQQDVKHLEPVIRFGWRTEKRMARMVESPESYEPDAVLRALITHGAVQLPFSMPVQKELMDRYQSESVRFQESEYVLDHVFDKLANRNLNVSGKEILRMLWRPRSFNSALSGDRVLYRMMGSFPRILFRDCLDYLAHELRDLPDLSESGRKKIQEDMYELVAVRLESDTDTTKLAAKISRMEAQHQSSRTDRADLLERARLRLEPSAWNALRLWADYLEMKAETNETHSLYRGLCFIWFAEIHYSPNCLT